jgi:NADH:ubiquinone oxidoreductase subunit H
MVNPASKSDAALTPAIVASALAISIMIMPDSFASCKSLARLNSTIDTTNKTQCSYHTVSILFVLMTVKRTRIAQRITVNFASQSRVAVIVAVRQAWYSLAYNGVISSGSLHWFPLVAVGLGSVLVIITALMCRGRSRQPSKRGARGGNGVAAT